MGVHTQIIESYWARTKRKFKRMKGVTEEQLPSYLDEFMWRERYRRMAYNNITTHKQNFTLYNLFILYYLYILICCHPYFTKILKSTHQYFYQVNCPHIYYKSIIIKLNCNSRYSVSFYALTKVFVILSCVQKTICMWNGYGHQKSFNTNVLKNAKHSSPLPSSPSFWEILLLSSTARIAH